MPLVREGVQPLRSDHDRGSSDKESHMSTPTDVAPLGYPEASEKGLKGGALGLLSSIVVGLSLIHISEPTRPY